MYRINNIAYDIFRYIKISIITPELDENGGCEIFNFL